MPISIQEETDGKVIHIHIMGKLVKEDYGGFTAEFDRLLKIHGKMHVLFDITGIEGLDAGAVWEDLKFGVKHFADIDRMAMVGDEKWQRALTTLFKPFSKATIQYFDHADTVAARKWLVEA